MFNVDWYYAVIRYLSQLMSKIRQAKTKDTCFSAMDDPSSFKLSNGPVREVNTEWIDR